MVIKCPRIGASLEVGIRSRYIMVKILIPEENLNIKILACVSLYHRDYAQEGSDSSPTQSQS